MFDNPKWMLTLARTCAFAYSILRRMCPIKSVFVFFVLLGLDVIDQIIWRPCYSERSSTPV
jgi:hypothetical protein